MSVNLNGDLSQWTLGETFANCASGQMLADSFRLHKVGAAVVTARKSSDVPSQVSCGRIIHSSLEIEVTTADASVGATDVMAVTYRGEGSEWAELSGEQAVTAFGYVKTNVPGFYNVVLSNGAETWHAAEPVLISAADYWTKFAVNFERFDSTWYYTDHRVGYTIGFTLMAGSSMTGLIGSWDSGVKFGASQQTNFAATVGNKFKVCGLRVAAYGDARESYQPPELTELACMRYLETSFARGQAPVSALGANTGELSFAAPRAGATTQDGQPQRFIVPKRKTPNMTGYNPIVAGAEMRDYSAAQNCTGTAFNKTDKGFRAIGTGHASTAIGNLMMLHWLADATLPALGVSVGS